MVDAAHLMTTCKNLGLGYLAWSWCGNNAENAWLDMTTNWGALNTWGNLVKAGGGTAPTPTRTATSGTRTPTRTATAGSGCTSNPVTPYVQVNSGSWTQTTSASLSAGGTVKFGPQPSSGGSWGWSGPNGFSAATREVTIGNIQTNQAGNYVATYTNACGSKSSAAFTVTVSGSGGATATRTATASGATRTATRTATGGSVTTAPATGCTCRTKCDARVTKASPFVYDGTGEFCWEASSLGSYINCWGTEIVEINGVVCTNKWVSASSIPAIGGKYYIYFKALSGYPHFEMK
jgi:hypothetical protein